MNDLQCAGCGSAEVTPLHTYTAGAEPVAVKAECRACGCVYVEDL